MTPDLETLVVAAYVFADDQQVPARFGRPPLVEDAELVALAVCQAAMGIASDRQFLGLVGHRLPGWFRHLPEQTQYNRRLRSLTGLLVHVQQRLARELDAGQLRLADGTLIAVANYPAAPATATSPATPATAGARPRAATSGASGWSWSPTQTACRSATRSSGQPRRSTSRSTS